MRVRPPSPADPWSESVRRLVVLGYITALAMPPLGFVLGLFTAIRVDRPHSRHGVWIMALSVAAAGLWVLLLTSGALNATGSGY